jgi:hypothetical protein
VTEAVPIELPPGDGALDADNGRFLPAATVPTGVLRNGSPGVSPLLTIIGVTTVEPSGVAVGACGVSEAPAMLLRRSMISRDSARYVLG